MKFTPDDHVKFPARRAGHPAEALEVRWGDLQLCTMPGDGRLWLKHTPTDLHVPLDGAIDHLAEGLDAAGAAGAPQTWRLTECSPWSINRPMIWDKAAGATRSLPGTAGNYLPTPPTIYVASKSCHAEKWHTLRDIGAPIISTWIDEADEGATADWADLWTRCVDEASRASHVLAYHAPGETWKGAFVEIGAALANDATVVVVGDPPGSWTNHPQVRQAPDLITALGEILAEGDQRKRSA